MQVKAKAAFAHGIYSLHKGEVAEIPDGIAADLLRAGFLDEAKNAPAPLNKMASEPKNKSKAK